MDSYTLERQGPQLVACIHGETTASLISDMKVKILAGMDDPNLQAVILDLSHVMFIDSMGINLLVTLSNRMKDAGKQLMLKNPSDRVSKVLKLVQLDTHFAYWSE